MSMAFTLTHNAYGKAAVRLTKVVRDRGPVHELFEIDAAVELEGDFAAAYTDGDNRQVVATDTIKNTVYVVAKENRFDSVEAFGLLLVRHFLKTYAHVTKATATLKQSTWKRIELDGKPHDHAFAGGGPQARHAKAVATRDATTIEGGVRDLPVLKTTQSAWADFHSDRYRTLKDTGDRILATTIDAEWTYTTPEGVDFNACDAAIHAAILKTFATEFSPGVQRTLQQMGEAALTACDAITSISFTLPNSHRIPFNLEPFGLKFENDIYVATDEPRGLIRGTVSR